MGGQRECSTGSRERGCFSFFQKHVCLSGSVHVKIIRDRWRVGRERSAGNWLFRFVCCACAMVCFSSKRFSCSYCVGLSLDIMRRYGRRMLVVITTSWKHNAWTWRNIQITLHGYNVWRVLAHQLQVLYRRIHEHGPCCSPELLLPLRSGGQPTRSPLRALSVARSVVPQRCLALT